MPYLGSVPHRWFPGAAPAPLAGGFMFTGAGTAFSGHLNFLLEQLLAVFIFFIKLFPDFTRTNLNPIDLATALALQRRSLFLLVKFSLIWTLVLSVLPEIKSLLSKQAFFCFNHNSQVLRFKNCTVIGFFFFRLSWGFDEPLVCHMA